jgi:hypothetical protein
MLLDLLHNSIMHLFNYFEKVSINSLLKIMWMMLGIPKRTTVHLGMSDYDTEDG